MKLSTQSKLSKQ